MSDFINSTCFYEDSSCEVIAPVRLVSCQGDASDPYATTTIMMTHDDRTLRRVRSVHREKVSNALSYSSLMQNGSGEFRRTMIQSQLARLKYEIESEVDIDSITLKQLVAMSLSEIVKVTYACLLRAERDEEVVINMQTWHELRDSQVIPVFEFCFAGALMHYVFKLRDQRRHQTQVYSHRSLVRYALESENIFEENKMIAVFHALNALRAGDCETAESIFHSENECINASGDCVYSRDKDAFHEMIVKHVLPDLEMRDKQHKRALKLKLEKIRDKQREDENYLPSLNADRMLMRL